MQRYRDKKIRVFIFFTISVISPESVYFLMIGFLFNLGEFDVIKELLEKLPESKDGKTKIDRYPSYKIFIFLLK